MAYPFLPVNPCCTDVVINDPCGCSSVITNSGCNSNNPCSTNLTASSTIVYNGPLLTCTTAEPCDTLNVILQKIDSIICNLLTQINTLNIQVNNITTQIITINGDIININNQLDNCCNATTTSTSTTIYVAPCESFLLTNIGAVPLAIIVTDCITGMQEPIVLLPGDTNICVETDSPLVLPGTVIATPTGPCPSTTTTTTTICEGFSLFNPSLDPIDVIVTPCNTGIEEILSVDTGTTYVCLLGGASFTIDDPIILTPQGPCPTTTTTTTLFIPCECITFTNTDDSSHYFSYTNCSNDLVELVSISSGEIVSVCGCCGEASDSYVTISVGANCIQGICPPTTSTTTTEPPVICLFTGIANQIPNPITTTTTSSTTIATVPILNTGGTGYQASGTTCDAINYPYSLEFSLPTPNNFATMFTPDKLWSDIEYVEIVSTSTAAGLEIQYDGITVTPGLQLIPTSASDWQYPLIITRSSFDCTNLEEVWEVTIKLYGFTELTNTALFFTSFSQSNCPECTTTTTTTKLSCSNFELQGLTGGGSWTGLDCYTELFVGDSVVQGSSEPTGCIISSSLEVTNLAIKGESPCLTTTTTTTLLSDCYIVEGIWEVDDPAHPAGGYVDYIDEFGNNQSLSGLWVIDSINIIASSIITSSGVTVTPSDCSTTTTTTSFSLSECAIFINDNNGTIVTYDISTNIVTPLLTTVYSRDIANTTTRIWIYDNATAKIAEYTITLSPWTIVFNRYINYPVGVYLGAGLCAVDNTKLITTNQINLVPNTIIEIDITGSTAIVTDTIATLDTDYFISGDIVLSTTGKVICITQSGFIYKLTQYDRITGVKEVDSDISSYYTTEYPLGLIENDNKLYILGSSGSVKEVNLSSPYALTLIQTSTFNTSGASSAPQCSTVNLIVASTTTTTSTTASVCTIPIDTQLWGCANLDVTEYANGDAIPEVTDQATWAALTTGAWCYYNNDPANGAIYGKLYNWYAVNDPRGLVPAGYHVPTNTDCINLINYLGGDLVAGGPLKEAGTVHWTSPNVGATNSSGFTGLPGGFRDTAGAFQFINDDSYWWTSTVIDPSSSYIYGLNYSNAATSPTSGTGGFLQDGYSVRLLQD